METIIYIILALVAALVGFLVYETVRGRKTASKDAPQEQEAVSEGESLATIKDLIVQAAQDLKDEAAELQYSDSNSVSHEKLMLWLQCKLSPEESSAMEEMFGCRVLRRSDRKDDPRDTDPEEKEHEKAMAEVHAESRQQAPEAIAAEGVQSPYAGSREEEEYRKSHEKGGEVKEEYMELIRSQKSAARAEYLAQRCGIAGYSHKESYTPQEETEKDREMQTLRQFMDAQPLEEVVETFRSRILDNEGFTGKKEAKSRPVAESLFQERDQRGHFMTAAKTRKKEESEQ